MRKNKKGYAMAFVVVTMAVVMTLSGLVLALLSITNSSQQTHIKNLERNLIVSEFSTAYANKNFDDFVEFCVNTKGWINNDITLTSPDSTYTITITQTGGEETFKFVQTKSQRVLANLHKTNNVVDVWQYK